MYRSVLLFLPALTLLLTAGCGVTPNVEGDEPGECSDQTDNDQDGVVDCDDDGCTADGACSGDDDDSEGDDDTADDDDDSAGDDDDSAGDDDDSAGDDDDSAGDDDDSAGDDDDSAGDEEAIVDECAEGLDDCDPLVSCIDLADGYVCGACPTGYDDVNDDGTECADLDECALGTDYCDSLTTCSNTPGGYSCGACPAGYDDVNGDGTDCPDLDECSLGTDSCDPLAPCQNQPGSYSCGACPAGYNDVNGDGTQCVAIVNSPPSGTPVVSVSPTSPTRYENLQCLMSSGVTDPDGDWVSYFYSWLVDGVDSGIDTPSVPFSATLPYEEWTCTVTPSDGSLNGTAGTDSVTIVNTAPGPPTVIITPENPLASEDLTCSVSVDSSDAEGDPVTYAFAWQVGTADAGNASEVVQSTSTSPGEEWTCIVTPNDGAAEGTPAQQSVQITCNDGSGSGCASTSCLQILNDGLSGGDDVYWLDPDGSDVGADAFQAYCDMTTDFGGWTLIAQGGAGNCAATGMSSSSNMTDSDACSYLPFATVSSLAGSATEVMLQVGGNASSFGDWTGCYTEPCTTVSTNSLAVDALTSSTGTWHNGSTWSEWDWTHSCSPSMTTGWPRMYQACGNASGVHWTFNGTAYCHNADGGASGTYNLISATWLR